MALSIPSIFSLCLLLSLLSIALSDDPDNQCVYTAYVRTSSIWKGGTDATISLTLYTGYGESFLIEDLKSWGGLMGYDYDYFERGNLDVFSGRGPCLSSSVCAMNLTSNGSGAHHGWYCNYVEVTTTGPHIPCHQELFTVEQWLATDAPPYDLTAIRNNCGDWAGRKGGKGHLGDANLKAVV